MDFIENCRVFRLILWITLTVFLDSPQGDSPFHTLVHFSSTEASSLRAVETLVIHTIHTAYDDDDKFRMTKSVDAQWGKSCVSASAWCLALELK